MAAGVDVDVDVDLYVDVVVDADVVAVVTWTNLRSDPTHSAAQVSASQRTHSGRRSRKRSGNQVRHGPWPRAGCVHVHDSDYVSVYDHVRVHVHLRGSEM